MERRTYAESVTANVQAAIDNSGATPAEIAEATDINPSVLEERLANKSPFEIEELVVVGGFLRVSPTQFLGGAAA